MTSRSVTRPVFGLGVMVRWRWKELALSAVQTQEPKTKVSPLLRIEAFEFAVRSSERCPT
jgi:hypothetical protein